MYPSLSLMLGYLEDSLLIRSAYLIIQSVWEPVPKPYIFLSYRSQLKKISEREFSFQPQKARLEWGSHIMPAGKEILP